MGEAVTFHMHDKIGIITLNRSDHKNAITTEIAMALTEIKGQIEYGRDVVALIITGKGQEAFCAGTDAHDYSAWEDREERMKRLQIASTVGSYTQPVIAAINGDAFDQGLELALACDIRIASSSACFAMSQISSGVLPWDGGTQRLSRLIGRAKALEMILLGETVNADHALKIGLVSHVVPADELMSAALKMAQSLAEKGPIALRYAKEAVYKGMDLTLGQGLRLEADLYFLLHTTEDRTEGITAFREKRSPVFKGK